MIKYKEMIQEFANRKKERVVRSASLFHLFTFSLLLTSCFGSKLASSGGGEVTGTGGKAFTEPTPYGMTLIKRGHLKMGIEKTDSLWGRTAACRHFGSLQM